jgi:hypothetical protein
MRLNEHFDGGDEVEKVGETTEMNAPPAPAFGLEKHGREDGDTCRRVKNCRNSEPEEMHSVHNLKALALSIL